LDVSEGARAQKDAAVGKMRENSERNGKSITAGEIYADYLVYDDGGG
jgi:hypothetical protein